VNTTPPPCPIPESYWVEPGRFLAGEYPALGGETETTARINSFLKAGFNTFIDLTREGELVPYASILSAAAPDVTCYRFPIGDFGLPTVDQMHTILNTLDTALSAGRKVYLHCWGGVGRTGTTVGCYLVRKGLSGEEALAQLADWWRSVPKSARFLRSPETDAQVRFILDWKD
jgi:protein tyrosine/serine phosphatase